MKNDKWARIIGIPIVGLVMALAHHLEILLRLDVESLAHYLISTFTTLLLWEGNRYIFIRMKDRYPGYHNTERRVIYQTLISVVYTLFVATAILYAIYLVFPEECRFDPPAVFRNFLTSLIPTLFITSIYESVYFFKEWKINIQRTEALAKENIRSQFESLKNQLDPHFLFNSLNTLAALIDEENAPAQKYLEQLSDVYRYVLVSKERNAVPLKEELAFLQSYVYLNKTRYRENLVVDLQVHPDYLNYQVAPLSLQMLIENAIKHNIVSRDKPLTITIRSDETGYLTVENNRQDKTTFEKSTKVGLQNIINRYRLLTEKPVEVNRAEKKFTVRIPLLNPAHESVNY
jgi:two-component system, LytTR family, sensor kinase